MVVLGFDPGGAKPKRFGWYVAEATGKGRLELRHSGIEKDADSAVSAALRDARGYTKVVAAGIDSPLFWVARDGRRADQTIRNTMTRLRARNVGGTVQQVNSLRGARVVQGIMAARLLRRAEPEIRITESHPKALLWLLSVATTHRRVAAVKMKHLRSLITCRLLRLSEHERDAALGAVAAWAMMSRLPGWRDLCQDEKNAFAPVPRVEYWMPINEFTT